MISNKMAQLKQDMIEVEGKIEDLETYVASYSEFENLKDWFSVLKKHLNDHIETVEIFMSDNK